MPTYSMIVIHLPPISGDTAGILMTCSWEGDEQLGKKCVSYINNNEFNLQFTYVYGTEHINFLDITSHHIGSDR